MQIKDNQLNYLQNPWLNRLVKLVFFLGAIYFITHKLQGQSHYFSFSAIPEDFEITYLIVCILMFLNWYLEALRWKVSLNQVESITINKAWKMVLSGVALNWVLPFTSGDLLARITQIRDKYSATSAVVLNRAFMVLFTLLLGSYGLSYLVQEYQLNSGLILFMILGSYVIFLLRRYFFRFYAYFNMLSMEILGKVAFLSFLRYGVFIFQFYLLLHLFLPNLSISLTIAGIGWIFLVRSILPLFLGGLGVREASGVFFFQPFVQDIQLVIIPITSIWIINTVLPSLVGIFFIWRLKLSSNISD